MSGTLLNPRSTAVYDPKDDRIVVSFRDGRDCAVVEFDADALPALINALMAARCLAKQTRKAVPLPPPMARPSGPIARARDR